MLSRSDMLPLRYVRLFHDRVLRLLCHRRIRRRVAVADRRCSRAKSLLTVLPAHKILGEHDDDTWPGDDDVGDASITSGLLLPLKPLDLAMLVSRN